MLHALLRGKCQPGLAEPDRLEDVVTSTVLGSLVLVGAWDVLGEALGVARSEPHDSWFWPRLAWAEPDAILRFGSVLLVIEAKYGSRKHDAAPQTPQVGTDEIRDQLVREWNSVSPAAPTDRYPTELAQALAECTPELVYLVDGRRARRAKLDVKESLDRSPNAHMRVGTWQGIHAALHNRSEPWAGMLRRFLERCGLASFCGDWAPLREAAHSGILAWQTGPGVGEQLTFLAAVRPLADERARAALSHALARVATGANHRQAWRVWWPPGVDIDRAKSLTRLSFRSGE